MVKRMCEDRATVWNTAILLIRKCTDFQSPSLAKPYKIVL